MTEAEPSPPRRRDRLPAERRRARVLSLKALYEADQAGHDPVESVSRLAGDEPAHAESLAFALRLVTGIKERREEIDGQIGAAATQWPVDQLAVVDRNILRIAIYEMLLDGSTPVRVAVNEAVELAKRFGAESSPRFVNGVLGALSVQRE